jgi:hypothetical protein
MKFVLLCAALSFVVWTAPARAEELCIGPACVGTGEHRNRDRDEGLERREHRDEGRELRKHREPDEGREHREHREPDEGRAER